MFSFENRAFFYTEPEVYFHINRIYDKIQNNKIDFFVNVHFEKENKIKHESKTMSASYFPKISLHFFFPFFYFTRICIVATL